MRATVNRALLYSCLLWTAVTLSCQQDPHIPNPAESPRVFRGTQHWVWHQIPFDEELNAIAGSEIGYVIAGASSMTKYSGDGKTWHTGSWAGLTDYLAATTLGDVFSAVGTGPYSSLRGYALSVSSRTGQLNTLRSLAWSGAMAVAVGDAGEVITTSDGRSWERHDPIATEDFDAVTWTGDHFLCAGDKGKIYSSADGAKWTIEEFPTESRITGLATTTLGVHAVTTAGGIWRQDPAGWIQVSRATGVPLRAITGFKSRLVAVGDNASLATSSGRSTWQRWTLDVDTDFRAVTAHDRFVAVGTNRVILASNDGTEWEERPSFPPYDLYDIASNNEGYVVVGRRGVLRSMDGREWHEASAYGDVYAVSWAGDHYVACGKGGLVLTSPTGQSWTKRSGPANEDLWSVHWTGSETIIGGGGGRFLLTSNYQQWEEANCPSTGGIFGITQSPSRLVAVTTGGQICVSVDGRSWSVSTISCCFDDVIWTGSEFVALVSNGVYRSWTGDLWRYKQIQKAGSLRALGFDGESVYAVGNEGRIFRSENLDDWYGEESGFEPQDFLLNYGLTFNGVMAAGSNVIVVGDQGTILTRKVD